MSPNHDLLKAIPYLPLAGGIAEGLQEINTTCFACVYKIWSGGDYCRLVKYVGQCVFSGTPSGKRSQGSHREPVPPGLPGSEPPGKIFDQEKLAVFVNSLLVFSVAAIHIAAIPGCIGANML